MNYCSEVICSMKWASVQLKNHCYIIFLYRLWRPETKFIALERGNKLSGGIPMFLL